MLEGVCVCAVFAEIGIALGAYLKGKKHSRIREVAGPTILTGLFAGVTEPILYGIIMNYKRLLAVVAIASGIGGAINGALHVTCDAFVFHNIFSLAMRTYSPFMSYLLGISTALLAGALMTYFWGISAEDMEDFAAEPENTTETSEQVNESEKESIKETEGIKEQIKSPLTGDIIPLKDVEDEVFASGVAGQGFAIRPSEGIVKAPCDGSVTVVFPSKHAIGLTSENGVEILIHIGLNTVMMAGEGFEVLVSQGDQIKEGQPMLRFDPEFIHKKGYSLTSPILVTNADDYKEISIAVSGKVQAGELIYKIIR